MERIVETTVGVVVALVIFVAVTKEVLIPLITSS